MSAIGASLVLLGYTAIGGGVPAYYAWVDHHGVAKWEAYKAVQAAKGEELELSALIDTAPIPAKQNFASHPLFAGLFEEVPPGAPQPAPATAIFEIDQIPGLARNRRVDRDLISGWPAAQGRNLNSVIPEGLDVENQAKYVSGCLAPLRSKLHSIAGAAERPRCSFPTEWDNGFATRMPHLSALQTIAKALALDASASLRSGDIDNALLSLSTIIRIANHLEHEPQSLVSHLVLIAIRNVGYQALWDGLRLQAWEGDDLRLIEKLLSKAKVDEAYNATMRFERALIIKAVSDFSSGEFDIGETLPLPSGYGLAALIPKGLWYENLLAVCELYDGGYFALPPYPGCAVRRFDAAFMTERIQQWRKFPRPDRVLARATFPVFGTVSAKSIQAEAILRLARIAIALERHKLDQRSYPESLRALSPKYLKHIPVDPITGRGFRYELRGERPALWSIGINEIDEGGRPKKSSQHGDWAWQYSLPGGYSASDYRSNKAVEIP